tara:strand:+ start:919 stop:1221 length:303 start_codon:yes stop_codon:yes gene_type:complete
MAIIEGNIGVTFVATFVDENDDAIDLGAATTLELTFVKPDCTEVVQPAVATGEKGEVKYVTTLVTDLDQPGGWSFYGHAILPLEDWKTLPSRFDVRAVGV